MCCAAYPWKSIPHVGAPHSPCHARPCAGHDDGQRIHPDDYPNFYQRLAAFVDTDAVVHLTVFTQTQTLMPKREDQQRHLDRTADAVRGKPNVILSLVNENTRVVAVTGASNLLGTRPDVVAIGAGLAATDALFYVDGVHLTAHTPVDMEAIGADFYVCSPYKFLGPHTGMLAASPALLETLHPDKLRPSTEQVPERFELGTLPYELLAGVTAAAPFIYGQAMVAAQQKVIGAGLQINMKNIERLEVNGAGGDDFLDGNPLFETLPPHFQV